MDNTHQRLQTVFKTSISKLKKKILHHNWINPVLYNFRARNRLAANRHFHNYDAMASAFLSQQPAWLILNPQVIELVALNSCSCYDSVFFFIVAQCRIPTGKFLIFRTYCQVLQTEKQPQNYTKKPVVNFCTGLLLHLTMLKQRLQKKKKKKSGSKKFYAGCLATHRCHEKKHRQRPVHGWTATEFKKSW